MVVGSVLALSCHHRRLQLNQDDCVALCRVQSSSWVLWAFVILSMLLGRVATAQLSGLVTLLEFSVRSYLVGNAGSRPISEAKQPWACLVLRWGTTGEAHVLYSPTFELYCSEVGCTWIYLGFFPSPPLTPPPPPPLPPHSSLSP